MRPRPRPCLSFILLFGLITSACDVPKPGPTADEASAAPEPTAPLEAPPSPLAFPLPIELPEVLHGEPVPIAPGIWVGKDALHVSEATGPGGPSEGTHEVALEHLLDLNRRAIPDGAKRDGSRESMVIEPLRRALLRLLERERARLGAESQPTVNLWLDADLRFRLVFEVVHTASLAGFTRLGLVVGKPGSVTMLPFSPSTAGPGLLTRWNVEQASCVVRVGATTPWLDPAEGPAMASNMPVAPEGDGGRSQPTNGLLLIAEGSGFTLRVRGPSAGPEGGQGTNTPFIPRLGPERTEVAYSYDYATLYNHLVALKQERGPQLGWVKVTADMHIRCQELARTLEAVRTRRVADAYDDLVQFEAAEVRRGPDGRVEPLFAPVAFAVSEEVSPAPTPTPDKPGYDKEGLAKVLRDHRPELDRCYEETFKELPRPTGRVKVKFQIGLEGRIERIKLQRTNPEGNPLLEPSLRACIVTRMKTWQFPKPVGGPVTYSKPFEFPAL